VFGFELVLAAGRDVFASIDGGCRPAVGDSRRFAGVFPRGGRYGYGLHRILYCTTKFQGNIPNGIFYYDFTPCCTADNVTKLTGLIIPQLGLIFRCKENIQIVSCIYARYNAYMQDAYIYRPMFICEHISLKHVDSEVLNVVYYRKKIKPKNILLKNKCFFFKNFIIEISVFRKIVIIYDRIFGNRRDNYKIQKCPFTMLSLKKIIEKWEYCIY